MQSCNLSSTNTRVRSISGTKSTKSRILYHLLVPRFQKCDILFWIGGTQCHWPVASDLIIRRVRRNITMLNSKPISWCKVIHLECQTSWQGCFRRVELCFFCCFLCYRNGVHSLILQIIGLGLV